MADDIVPALLETINQQFDLKAKQSAVIHVLLDVAQSNKATYLDANKFAIKIGEILADVLGSNITSAALPDGRMYYNIGQRILSATLKKNHDLITGFTDDVQSQLNKRAGIGLKVQTPAFDEDRVAGIVNRLDSEENFDDVAWMLKEPVVNFSQSVVDDAVKANVEFQAKAGLHPTLTRHMVGKGCKWCRGLAGVYQYPDVPADIYRRHENDRCTVEYDPGSGKRQDVWSKQWTDLKKKQQIEARAQIGLKTPNYSGPSGIGAHKRGKVHPQALPNWQNAYIDRDKFVNYSLDLSHPKGGAKAKELRDVLGLTSNNYRMIVNQIRSQLPYYKAIKSYKNKWGQFYAVIMPVTGPNGATTSLLTYWIDEGQNQVRLTNVYRAHEKDRRKYK